MRRILSEFHILVGKMEIDNSNKKETVRNS
jgi:hypothetical protein